VMYTVDEMADLIRYHFVVSDDRGADEPMATAHGARENQLSSLRFDGRTLLLTGHRPKESI
jgi:hypothetical protein